VRAIRLAAPLIACLLVAAVAPPLADGNGRLEGLERRPVLRELGIPPFNRVLLSPIFRTGFEREQDLAGFYSTPQSPATRHQVRRGSAHSGERAHVAWLTGDPSPEPVDGPNHRGYPTIQLQRRPAGPCTTPCLVDLWVKVNGVRLEPGEWWSLATLSSDPSDAWSRVVTVNFGWEGWTFLFHVPNHGLGDREFQRTNIPFPQGRWARITIWLDFRPQRGAAAVWQNGRLVSAARVRGGDGSLDQMHFGLYAPPTVTSGTVMNDDIAVLTARRQPTRP